MKMDELFLVYINMTDYVDFITDGEKHIEIAVNNCIIFRNYSEPPNGSRCFCAKQRILKFCFDTGNSSNVDNLHIFYMLFLSLWITFQ